MTGPSSRLWWTGVLVAVISFAYLVYGVKRSGVAAALTNPVDHIHAQDESVYAAAALHMATQGNWLTPVFMGRLFLFKPPMLEVLSGISLKTFGVSLWALRLPSLLSASLAGALLFIWSVRTRGYWAAVAAVLLLLSNSVWVTFARLCYTDMLQASFTVAAMFSVALDPRLERLTTRWSFIAFDAAAILSKSVAGVLPLIAVGLFSLVGPREARPPLRRILQIAAWVALCIAPWHFYQLVVHRQWFWTDYIQVQLLDFGFQPLLSGSAEAPLLFYLKRVFLTDPFLSIAAVLALPGLIKGVRLGNADARLLACWLGVVLAGVSAFRYRNFYYALMLIAPLCLAAGLYLTARYPRGIAAGLALVFALKMVPGESVWSLSYSASDPLAAAPLLRAYLDRGRSNDLILVDPDDEFYAATLPLPKVRYCFRDPADLTIRYAPYYVNLGITVRTSVFNDLTRWEPIFRERLRKWGLDSSEPIAAAIVAHNDSEIAEMIRLHPDSDFYLPRSIETAVRPGSQSTHVYVPASATRFFLLANRSATRVSSRASMLE